MVSVHSKIIVFITTIYFEIILNHNIFFSIFNFLLKISSLDHVLLFDIKYLPLSPFFCELFFPCENEFPFTIFCYRQKIGNSHKFEKYKINS